MKQLSLQILAEEKLSIVIIPFDPQKAKHIPTLKFIFHY
jgi:hypothetical protein